MSVTCTNWKIVLPIQLKFLRYITIWWLVFLCPLAFVFVRLSGLRFLLAYLSLKTLFLFLDIKTKSSWNKQLLWQIQFFFNILCVHKRLRTINILILTNSPISYRIIKTAFDSLVINANHTYLIKLLAIRSTWPILRTQRVLLQ